MAGSTGRALGLGARAAVSHLLGAVLLFTAMTTLGATWYAKPAASGTGAGTSWANAATLQGAMETAASGDQIWVMQGTHVPSSFNFYDEGIHGNDTRHRHFAPRDGVAIYGGFVGTETELSQRDWQSNLTVLDGDLGASGKVYHVLVNWFSVPGASTILDGLVIANGNANGALWHASGGGMLSVGDNVNPTVRNCTFRDNTAVSYGGAFFADAGADATFMNCIFRNNTSGNLGGAITLFANCTGTISGCLFHDNTGAYGGAILLDGASPTLAVANCTFADNTSTDMGGGGLAILGPATTIVNSIFWGNLPDGIYDRDTTTAVTYSNVQGGIHPGAGNISTDPLFAGAATGNYRLQAASPGIDVGSNAGVPVALVVDLDGTDRILDFLGGGPIVDMGAYEYTTPPETATLTMAVDPLGYGTTTPVVGSHEVEVGAPVAITATPSGDNVFVNWTVTAGNASIATPNAASTTVTVNDAGGATIQANFADEPPETATLTMAVSDGAAGATDPAVGAHVVEVGVPVDIEAMANPGHAFVNWTVMAGSATIADANAISTTATVNGAGGATVQANFAEEVTLTIAVSDSAHGAVSPAAGAHAVPLGVPQAISATAADGHAFVEWQGTADAAIANAHAAQTTVTLAGDATVTAVFAELELIAVGSQFDISNDEVGLAEQFTVKPKVTTVYTDPVTRIAGKKASAKVVTKVSAKLPVDDIACDWTKKIRLFNAKLLAARHKLGQNTAEWLVANPAQNQPLDLPLTLTSKQVANGIPQAVRTVNLAPPSIDDVVDGDPDLKGNPTLLVTGDWFGTKKPKVWFEYLLPGKGIKKLNAKILKPDATYTDAKGKGLFMDQRSGESRAVILRPAKLPSGIAHWEAVTHIVIDSGCGLGTHEVDLAP